ncbi:MAG: hypothetical protein JWO38_1043 [Gemmataceae bacterium]|nr:hypothetical protein [Gemmataceae bacterium]
MLKRCPRCLLMIPTQLRHCGCGYEFDTGTAEQPPLPSAAPSKVDTAPLLGRSELAPDPRAVLLPGLFVFALSVVVGGIVGFVRAVDEFVQIAEQIQVKDPNQDVHGLLSIPYLLDGTLTGSKIGALVGIAGGTILVLRRHLRR